MNSASLCSLAGRYENHIPPRCLAPIDFLKISAQVGGGGGGSSDWKRLRSGEVIGNIGKGEGKGESGMANVVFQGWGGPRVGKPKKREWKRLSMES